MTLPQYGQNIVQIDLASITDALGALADAAATGDPTAVDTAMAYLKQIVNALLGSAGIATFPAAADPADGVNIAQVLRRVFNLVDSAETTGPFTYLDAGGEQDVVEDTATTRRHISVEFDLTAMTQNGTIRLYRRVDGVTYQIFSEVSFVAADAEQVFEYVFTTNQHWRLTYQEAVDEGADRSIPFNVITEATE